MGDVVDVEGVVAIVAKILLKFSELFNEKTPKTIKKFHHIEIEIFRDGDICSIQLVNCGKIIDKNKEIIDIINFGYSDVNFDGEIQLAMGILRESNSQSEEIFEATFLRGTARVRKIANSTQEELIIPSLSDYFILRIEQKISRFAGEKFVENMIECLQEFAKNFPRIKYIFKMEDHEFYNNSIPLDGSIANCKLLSSAIDKILTQSVNKNFRDDCFKLLQIEYSAEVPEVITSKLVNLINKKYRV